MTNRLLEHPLFVDGAWLPASGDPIEVIDPTTEDAIITVSSASAEEVERALNAAASAQKAWGQLTAATRGAYLRRIADVFAAHREELAKLIVREVGKPVSQALDEVKFAEDFMRFNADWDRRIEGDILPGDVPGEVINLLRVPVGVVVAICPWNFPLAVLCRKIAPALVTGNTVVVKPSEVSPLSTIEAFRLIGEHVRLPRGVLNLVTGGSNTGAVLVGSPTTSLVSFTGHRDTGKAIMVQAANNLTRVSLELGGKAPAIVWKDADLDVAVPAIIAARHTNSGQVCTSAERVLVHTDLLEPFTDRYVRAAQALTLGNPSGPVDLGPLVSKAQLAKTTAALANAVGAGAEIVSGGGQPTGEQFTVGYWHEPTVLRAVKPAMDVMQEEVFGPITPIMGFESFEEALEIANESRYGLSAYIFSNDYRVVMQAIDGLESGEIFINRTLGESVHAHHAGFKESGIGGEDGKWGLLRYTQIKTVYHRHG